MSILRFTALILATFLIFSMSNAHDSKGTKKSSKKETTCCSEKNTGKDLSDNHQMHAKKDGSKSCCDMENKGVKAKDGTSEMDCCAKEKKVDESKKEQSTIMKETK